ncbi:MAG: FecCD family ABC transporter permease [Nocardioides sp.]
MSTSQATAAPESAADPRPPRQGSVRGIAVLALALLAAGVLGLMIGSRAIGPGDVLSALFDPDGGEISTIVHELRLPRTVLAIAVGLALGVGGALMQGHTRNPLADPGLLGVTAGASFAVVLGIFVFGVTSLTGYAWFSLAGAGLAAAAVFAIGSTRGGPDPVSLVLAGTAVSALLLSLTQAIVLRDVATLDDFRFWNVGSTAGRDFDVVWQVAPFIVAGLLLAAISAPGLNLLQLGDDVATSLGMHPTRHKVLGITTVMLLTGAATAACGPVAFVGLVVPHVARFFGGVDYRWLLPYAGLTGGLLMILADVLGRVVVRPGELQVGIVLAVVGGPVFVYLVRRTRLVSL